MKKLFSILMMIALFATLSFAQASGNASDTGKDNSAKSADKGKKKGKAKQEKAPKTAKHHKGGKKDKDKGGEQK